MNSKQKFYCGAELGGAELAMGYHSSLLFSVLISRFQLITLLVVLQDPLCVSFTKVCDK